MILRYTLAVLAAFLFTAVPAEASTCTGPSDSVIAPLTRMNPANMMPISIMGVSMNILGSNRDCPAMSRRPACLCPGRLGGLPTPGFMLTFHQPKYVAEVVGPAGCSPLLNGTSLLGGAFRRLSSGIWMGPESNRWGHGMTRQIHWFEYPVFEMLQVFAQSACLHATNVFDLAYMTELDPLWNDDEWAAIFTPEAALFTSMHTILACPLDAIASTVTRCHIDSLIWCAGAAHGYPWSGANEHMADMTNANTKALYRFMARQSRLGVLWQTVGPSAVCSPHPNPIMIPSQYRLDLIYPHGRTSGRPIAFGTEAAFWGTIANEPFAENALYLIWVANQCCLNF